MRNPLRTIGRTKSAETSGVESVDRPLLGGGRWRRVLAGPRQTILAGILIVPLLMVAGLTAIATASVDPSDAQIVSIETLERDYGVHFDLVGVTAAGGLIEVRFTVLDTAKATALFHDEASSPALFVERSGAILHTKRGAHHLSLLPGARYFFLYSNTEGVVQAGTPVSIVIGGIRLEPISAQS